MYITGQQIREGKNSTPQTLMQICLLLFQIRIHQSNELQWDLKGRTAEFIFCLFLASKVTVFLLQCFIFLFFRFLRQVWCYQQQWQLNSSFLTSKLPSKLKAGGDGDSRGWDGWMASLTRWTWVWASSASQWWTVKPDMVQSMGSQRVRHDWVTELNWSSKL